MEVCHAQAYSRISMHIFFDHVNKAWLFFYSSPPLRNRVFSYYYYNILRLLFACARSRLTRLKMQVIWAKSLQPFPFRKCNQLDRRLEKRRCIWNSTFCTTLSVRLQTIGSLARVVCWEQFEFERSTKPVVTRDRNKTVNKRWRWFLIKDKDKCSVLQQQQVNTEL